MARYIGPKGRAMREALMASVPEGWRVRDPDWLPDIWMHEVALATSPYKYFDGTPIEIRFKYTTKGFPLLTDFGLMWDVVGESQASQWMELTRDSVVELLTRYSTDTVKYRLSSPEFSATEETLVSARIRQWDSNNIEALWGMANRFALVLLSTADWIRFYGKRISEATQENHEGQVDQPRSSTEEETPETNHGTGGPVPESTEGEGSGPRIDPRIRVPLPDGL